jgi:hypothetical protein
MSKTGSRSGMQLCLTYIYEIVISNCSWNRCHFMSYIYIGCDIILFIILNDAVILEAAHLSGQSTLQCVTLSKVIM